MRYEELTEDDAMIGFKIVQDGGKRRQYTTNGRKRQATKRTYRMKPMSKRIIKKRAKHKTTCAKR
uniref:Uncharacterized protein n=1 Tax=viral metagenome TaxID=1070528 RepID=A0A6C0I3T9_9ZZZZ